MALDYAIENKMFRTFKGRLTRAKNSGDPRKVIAAVAEFDAYYSQPGKVYPDDWARWERAKDDALFELRRRESAW